MSDGSLRKIFSEHLPRYHWTPIESGGTMMGVPDANGCVDGREFWIENKKTDAWAVKVQPGQVGWIERRLRCGGRVFVAVRRQTEAGPRKGAATDELWLLKGAAIRHLAGAPLYTLPAALALGKWGGGPRSWDWAAVGRVLLA